MIRCGASEYHQYLLKNSSAYRARRAAIEDETRRFSLRGAAVARTGIAQIQVVVHVVCNTASQNISDAQINSQISVLNLDYRMQNSDLNTAPAVFRPLAADARIQFQLATTDPAGNPTTGITRTSTTLAAFPADPSDPNYNSMKFSAQNGIDAWDPNRFLNIWVCPLGGGLLGYAQFPGGPAATDGVCIVDIGFGTTGTAQAPYNLGRSATHEIGHWLNLHHLWGDQQVNSTCSDGLTSGDFVVDTPVQSQANYNGPTYPHISCNNGPNGDMFMNFMDYVDDAKMVMFSAGQVLRMQAALDGSRSVIGT